jgi:hypothetical protein
MSNAAILYPVFVQVALTFILLVAMGRARVGAVRKQEVKIKEIALGQPDPWPERPKAIARSFHNQFETPLLFCAVVAMAIATHAVSSGMVVLAWIYVVLRLLHAVIHTGGNNINQRFAVFIVSVIALAAMWIMLGLHVATAGG